MSVRIRRRLFETGDFSYGGRLRSEESESDPSDTVADTWPPNIEDLLSKAGHVHVQVCVTSEPVTPYFGGDLIAGDDARRRFGECNEYVEFDTCEIDTRTTNVDLS